MRENYTNYSKPDYKTEEGGTPTTVSYKTEPLPGAENMTFPEVAEDEIGKIVDTINEATAEPEVEPIKPEPKTGIVTANKLNIRKLPSPNAPVVAVVDKDTQLMIEPDYETVEWFQVYTPAGIDGYCMKKFVTIK